MAAPARSVRRRPGRPRRLVAVGAVILATFLLTLDQMTAPRSVQQASGAGDALSAAAGATSWARDLAGTIVPVAPTHYDTPVNPEAITHPDADTMGSGERANAALPAASQAPGAQTSASQTPDTQASEAQTSASQTPDTTTPFDGTQGLAGSTSALHLDATPNPAAPAPAPAPEPAPAPASPPPPGIDVSSHQGEIDWASVAAHVDFVYAKATEGTYYRNSDFTNQYNGPYENGVIRGAYHFAIPSNSSGTAQADYFVAHGGGWSADGLTLPGALDIEYNPYGPECYGLTPAQMTAWISNFITEYAAKEHAYPVIYSTTNWWRTCTGNTDSFAAFDPFWVANYGSAGGPLPSGWDYYTFWQYSDSGKLPGDQDVFNGALGQLRVLAING